MDSIYFRPGYTIRDQNATHFLTFTVCGWIDLFTRRVYKDILVDSFRYCQKEKGLILNAFVIMSNHLHLIARAKQGCILSDIIRDFKKFTHRQMIKIIESDIESRRLWMLHQFTYYASRHSKNENYQIWTNDNHPEECTGILRIKNCCIRMRTLSGPVLLQRQKITFIPAPLIMRVWVAF